MAREITPSLIDMVLEHDEKHQGPLFAQIMGSLSESIWSEVASSRGDDTTTSRMGPSFRQVSGF
jgi:hypothetical protein